MRFIDEIDELVATVEVLTSTSSEDAPRIREHLKQLQLSREPIPILVEWKMMEDQSELLNEHQRRALSARLAMLDRLFYDVEQLLICDAPRGEMFEVIMSCSV